MDIKKFEQYEKVAEAARVLTWLRSQSILDVAFNDIEEIAMEYAGLHEPVYELWADRKSHVQSKSKSLIESQFKDFVDSDEYDNIQIKKEGKVIKEWVNPDAHAIKGKVDKKVEKVLNRFFILRIKTHNNITEKEFKTYNDALSEYSEAIATPYENETVWIEDNYGVVMIAWEIENSRPDGQRESAQITFDICKEFNLLNMWKGKADMETVRYILTEYACDYLKADGSEPSAQDKWMRAVHITGVKGKDFWTRAKGLYEAYKKATANPVAK